MRKLSLIAIILVIFTLGAFSQTADFEFTDVCLGDTTLLINTSTSTDPIVSIGWDLTNNGSFTDATTDTIKRVFTQTGVYTIGLRVITSEGDAHAIYQQIAVGNYPVADFIVESGCANEFSDFTNLSTAGGEELEDFIWTFGDGSTDNFSTHARHWYVFPGIYNVELIAISSYGCSDTITKNVEVNALPTFSLSFDGDTIFDEGESLTVTALGEFSNVEWSTGSTNDFITIETGGYYWAKVYNNGCPGTKTFNIIVNNREGVSKLFTPNGDGYNEFWEIFHYQDHAPCQVDIYSREGLKVYSSSNYSNNWDGTYNGKPLPEGAYIYIVVCNDNRIQRGTLNILR